jgi:hypothetical protein
MKFVVHFPEQTIEVDDHNDHCMDKRSAEFFATSTVVADSVEVWL